MNLSIVKIELIDKVEWWVIQNSGHTSVDLSAYYKRRGESMPPLDPNTFFVAICNSRDIARELIGNLTWRSKFVGKPICQWLKSEERIWKRNNAVLRGLYIGDES